MFGDSVFVLKAPLVGTYTSRHKFQLLKSQMDYLALNRTFLKKISVTFITQAISTWELIYLLSE
jgi:hypothetical protein